MKITRITANNIEAFRPLMPDEISYDESLLHLGAVTDDEMGCGCISAHIDGKVLFIDWLYTLPEYREEGVGDMLFKTVFLLSRESVDRIDVTFSEDDEGMEDFLMEHDFLVEEDEGIFRVPLEDLLYSSMMYDMLETVSVPDLSVKVVSSENIEELKKYLEEKGNDPRILEDISQALSIVRFDKENRIAGCLLTKDLGEKNLEVAAFYNDGSVSGITELTVGMYVLTKNDYGDHYLIFADRSGNASDYVEKMTGEEMENYRIKGIYRGTLLTENALA